MKIGSSHFGENIQTAECFTDGTSSCNVCLRHSTGLPSFFVFGYIALLSVCGFYTYNMVIHNKSEICIKYVLNCNCLCSWLPVHIMGSSSMQAMCGGTSRIFSYASTAGTLQEERHMGTGWICEHLYTRRVWLRYRYGYRRGTGETLEWKVEFHHQRQHINELHSGNLT